MHAFLKGFFLLFFTLTTAALASYEFYHEDVVNCTKIHTTMTGTYKDGTWTATNIAHSHLRFLTSLYTDPNVMSHLCDGKTRTEQDANNRIKVLTSRSTQGLPMGAWIPCDYDTKELGLMVAAPYNTPGYSEISYIIAPNSQNKGVGKSITNTVVQHWAPTVKEIGNRHDNGNLGKKFRCFKDQALSHLYATANPINEPSWKILSGTGFKPMPVLGNDQPILDFTASSPESYQQLNAKLIKHLKFFPNTHFSIIDHQGIERTASFHKTYGDMRFHFEYAIP